MLQALVEEMNYCNATVAEATKWLNIKLSTDEMRRERYIIRELTFEGKDIKGKLHRPVWVGNPVADEIVNVEVHTENMFGYKEYSLYFSPHNHLVSGNVTSGVYVLEDPQKGSRVVLMKAQKLKPAELSSVLVH